MTYLLYGFILGITIPYIARRFNKFMPATLGYALYKIIKPVKKTKKTSPNKYSLQKKYFYRSILIGIITGVIFFIFHLKYGSINLAPKLLFIWALILLAEIDKRTLLLPDIITFPLVLIGFYTSLNGIGYTDVINSSIAALIGYFLPVIASLFIIWKDKDALGGGDIKALAAIGAWTGVEILLFSITLSAISFGIYSIIKKQKSGAYGPWITYSTNTILILFA